MVSAPGAAGEDLAVGVAAVMLTGYALWHWLLGRPASESGRLRQGAGGYPRGDRRRQVLMLAILTADPALHLAARRNYLTGTLFRQIVARIERLARHPT